MNHTAYRNLNRRDGVWYSLRLKGKVIGHRQTIVMRNVKCKHATPAAIDRIRTGPREVCAWMLGELTEDQSYDLASMRRLCCDPKKVNWFTDAQSGARIDTCSLVVLCDSGCYYLP